MDLQPLLRTLTTLTDGRVVDWAERTSEGDLHIARIPVRFVESSDRTDQALRRYCKDWIRGQSKELAVDARFQPLSGQEAIFHDDRKEPHQTFTICGVLVLKWWPRPELPDMEKWKEEAEARRRFRRRAES
jgi:hypothetical protein